MLRAFDVVLPKYYFPHSFGSHSPFQSPLSARRMMMNRCHTNSHSALALAFFGGAALGCAAVSLMGKLKSRKSDNEKAEEHLWKIVEYSMTGALIHSGDKLDIYNKLYKLGPISAADLAKATGWSERWVREFLLQATASNIIEYKSGVFQIRPEYSRILRGPEHEEKSMAGTFQFLAALVSRTDAVVKAIESGIGVDYDHGTLDISTALDRKNGNFFRYSLVDSIIVPTTVPSTGENLAQVLARGCNVADVGCGCGASTIAMAKRFPNSVFFAFESSTHSINKLKNRMEEERLTNITICDVSNRTVADGPNPNDPTSKFQFVYTNDVLHDMTNPRGLIREVKERLATDGCWFIVDIDCAESAEENLRKPDAAKLYAYSCLLCLSMATSTKDGEGLGTCGFSSSLAERWMKEAGFNYFEKREVPALPGDACYLVA